MNNDASSKSPLDQWLSRKKKSVAPSKPGKMPAGTQPVLSHGQERLWLLEQLYPNQSLYNYAHHYRIRGTVDLDLLLQSFNLLLERHEILRSNYVHVDGVLTVEVQETRELPVSHFYWENEEPNTQEEKRSQEIRKAARSPFNLAEDSLCRLTVFHLGKETIEIVLAIHHIIGDAWSMGIINKEVTENYRSLTQGNKATTEPLALQYKDFAYWQRQRPTKEADLSFWKKKLAGELPVVSLPKVHAEQGQSFEGKTFHTEVPPNTTDRLRMLAKQTNTTMFVLLFAAYNVFLSKFTRLTDVLVASPFSNREGEELESLVGFFNETLVLRTDLTEDPDFKAVVEQAKTTVLDALMHKNVPFDELVKELKPNRQAGENPLFQTMFLYNDAQIGLDLGTGIEVEERMLDLGVSKFDLSLFVTEKAGQLTLAFEHALAYSDAQIESMSVHFNTLLESLVEQPTEPISGISVLSKAEQEKIVHTWNQTATPLPDVGSVHELIKRQIEKNPEALAVHCGSESLRYGELNRWSDAVAEQLVQAGVSPNQFVGLFTHRSLEMIVGILAILKAGAAYLPLDPDYPEERIAFMLDDAQVDLMLTQKATDQQLKSKQVKTIVIDRSQQATVHPEEQARPDQRNDYAYLIYTSGSTGKPKGVAVTHQNLLHSTIARFGFYEDQMQRFLLLSSFSFDSSITGIFWSLCSGGALVLPPKRIEQDIHQLSEIIKKQQVTHTLMLPSLYKAILDFADSESLQSLKAVIVAGEACSIQVRTTHFQSLPNARLYNEYGPTEASVWCIAYEITQADVERAVPIGKPISNATAYILDAQLKPLPIGVEGELYIGGTGVTKGYLNRPELTADRFLDHPFAKAEEKIYKTGDLAKFRPDGVIEFLGRADQQVKIRGYRVELEEIRAVILQQEGTTDALVLVRERDKKLIAYVQVTVDDLENRLLQQLKTRLPEYMVPAAIVSLPAFPKLPNGKVNRHALPEPEEHGPRNEAYIAPSNAIQQQLQDIWQEALQVPQIGVRDNFFDIGGDSILSIQIVARARQQKIQIGPTQIFEHQTIEDLSSVVKTLGETESIEEEDETYPKTLDLTYQQQAFLMHSLQAPADQGLLQLEFYLSGNIEKELFQDAWKKTVQAHPILRTSFHWENEDAAKQVIHVEADLAWDHQDFVGQSTVKQQESIEVYKNQDRKKGLDLHTASCSRMGLIRLDEQRFLLCWTCHHLLIDGWSGAIILQDALTQYEALLAQKGNVLKPVPSYAPYLVWKAEQDIEQAKAFWKEMLTAASPSLFGAATANAPVNSFKDLACELSPGIATGLQDVARKHRLTINSLMQGLWMATLGSFFGRDDVAVGLTVSGRSSDFGGMERITGLFMNVLPLRKRVERSAILFDWLHELQIMQAEVRRFEHIDADQIQQWQETQREQALFDSLFVFGNFLKDELEKGGLRVEAFKGGFSSTFPLTIRVNPAKTIGIDLRYQEAVVSSEAADWLMTTFVSVLNSIATKELKDGSLISDLLPAIPFAAPQSEEVEAPQEQPATSYVGPQNQVQFDLAKIWESILGTGMLDINESFFHLGGTSLRAIRLFHEVEQQFGKKLSPTTLIANPSIAKLSKLLTAGEVADNWSYIVPMKTTGDKHPLFCLHSGGAHVLFYQGLAKYMAADHPVYAIQPSGVDGNREYHDSIAAMAEHYIAEMQKVQPEGPYHLIGTCFSNAVGLEMAHQLRAKGKALGALYIIDSAPAYLVPPSPNGERKPIARMLAMVRDGNWNGISRKLKNRYIRTNRKLTQHKRTAAEWELDNMIESLNTLYVGYTWKPLDARIVLIRSTEFSQRKDKRFHLERWTKLSQGNLEVHEIAGEHLTLFDEPDVQGLAAVVGTLLSGKGIKTN